MMAEDARVRDDVYYAVLLDAFVNSRMERDKSLLALSSGGVGLTITLISTFGGGSNLQQICYWVMLGGLSPRFW